MEQSLKILFVLLIASFCLSLGAMTHEEEIAMRRKTLLEARENPEQYKNIKFAEDDDETVAYQKLLRYDEYFWHAPSEGTLDKLIQLGKKAHEKFPESAGIAATYAIPLYNSGIDNNVAKTIIMLSSYLEQDNPYTMMSLWYIFNSLEENLGRGDWAARIPHRLIGAVGDIKLAKYRFGLLRDFWLSKCTPGCSLQGDFDGKITRAKEMFASEKKKMEALHYWSLFLTNAARQVELPPDRVYPTFSSPFDMVVSNGGGSGNASDGRISQRDDNPMNEDEIIAEALDRFMELPNNLQKIELTLNEITKFRRKFRQDQYIPNYEKLAEKIGSFEAQVVNIGFLAYIVRDYARCLSLLNELPGDKVMSDPRLLTIKAYCMHKGGASKKETIKILEQLLELEPKNNRAFMLKRMLEAQEEFDTRKSD